MGALDHPNATQTGLKIVCEVCGSLSIKPIDPADAGDGVKSEVGGNESARGLGETQPTCEAN